MSRATRHFGIPQPVKGQTLLVEPGTLWRQQGQLADFDEPRASRRLPWGVCLAVWGFVLAPIWFGVIALIRWLW